MGYPSSAPARAHAHAQANTRSDTLRRCGLSSQSRPPTFDFAAEFASETVGPVPAESGVAYHSFWREVRA